MARLLEGWIESVPIRTVAAFVAVAAALTVFAVPARAQFEDPLQEKTPDNQYGVRIDPRDPIIYHYKCGATIKAVGGAIGATFGTIAVPEDWPEQSVRIVDEDITANLTNVRHRKVRGGTKQMVIELRHLGPNQTANALVTCEVKVFKQLPPQDPFVYTRPKRREAEVAMALAPSPFINPRATRITRLARDLTADQENDWRKAQALYHYVRDKIELRDSRLKGDLGALKDGFGGHEDLTSLFISLCRAEGVPARTVWVPDHTYAEFYLHDPEGEGHWFPAQVAGKRRAFGHMPEPQVILMKGDNFSVPELEENVRFVGEFLRGKPLRGGGRPEVKFVREPIVFDAGGAGF